MAKLFSVSVEFRLLCTKVGIPPHRIDVTPIHVLRCSEYKNFALNWLCFYSFKPTVLHIMFFRFSLLYILSICLSTVLMNKCVHNIFSRVALKRTSLVGGMSYEGLSAWVILNTYIMSCSLAGVSRSATIVVAYLMTVTSMGWQDALRYVRTLRSVVNPNIGFQRQLKHFQHSGQLDQVLVSSSVSLSPLSYVMMIFLCFLIARVEDMIYLIFIYLFVIVVIIYWFVTI